MAEKLTTNVLIIGKSGAGKSSLLNYLFDSQVEKTGVGEPVTDEGIYLHEYKLDENTIINIHDTWGLEADKADRWKKLVENEIKAHDAGSVKEWFHTIIYCINANVDRIEDFEIDFISNLVNDGNNLLIVLTHCDMAGSKNTIKGIKEILTGKGIAEDNIIEVCNEEKRLISGLKTERFGKEKIWFKIKRSLWDKIVEKVPKDLRKEAYIELENGRKKCFELIDKNIKLFTIHSNKKFNKINQECNEILNNCRVEIKALYTRKMREAMEFYTQLYQRFTDGNGEESENAGEYNIGAGMDYSMGVSDKINENLAILMLEFIPLVNICLPFMLTDIKRDECKAEINKSFRKMEKSLAGDEKKLRECFIRWGENQ